MRIMRGTGARGLACLYADTGILRPLIGLGREHLARYAVSNGVTWVEDPSNATPDYFRNRIRHDLLPAVRRVRPGLGADLLAASNAAAELRADVEAFVERHVEMRMVRRGELDVSVSSLAGHGGPSLAILWPAITARAGLVMDRRGLARLVQFTLSAQAGKRIQMSGAWQVVRSRESFELRPNVAVQTTLTALSLSNPTNFGDWIFRREETTGDGSWTARLPTDQPLSIRSWQPGDSMAVGRGGRPKKVKRLLSDAGLTGHKRRSWPVVLAGDRIVWIPGVGRSVAATDRSGRSGLPFVCEYVNC
jgi:tRNA(Ile)-lysidine synthase